MNESGTGDKEGRVRSSKVKGQVRSVQKKGQRESQSSSESKEAVALVLSGPSNQKLKGSPDPRHRV